MDRKTDERDWQHASRQAAAKWDRVRQIAWDNAKNNGMESDYAEDFSQEFVSERLTEGYGGAELTSDEVQHLAREADKQAKRYQYRRRRRRRQVVSLYDENGSLEGGPAGRLACHDPGPEELTLVADMMERLLLPLSEMTLSQQQLFVRRFLESARMVDLQEEMGRSANALYVAIHKIRKRFKQLLEGYRMSWEEIAEYLSMLALFHT